MDRDVFGLEVEKAVLWGGEGEVTRAFVNAKEGSQWHCVLQQVSPDSW